MHFYGGGVYTVLLYYGAADELNTYTQLTIVTRNDWKKPTEWQIRSLKRSGFSYAIHLWKIRTGTFIFP